MESESLNTEFEFICLHSTLSYSQFTEESISRDQHSGGDGMEVTIDTLAHVNTECLELSSCQEMMDSEHVQYMILYNILFIL